MGSNNMSNDPLKKDNVLNNDFGDIFSAKTDLRKHFLERLETLFAVMDQKYRQVAEQYGFHCQGCKDNCCRTTFYHHTLLEYLFLQEGFEQIDMDQQATIYEKAQTVSSQPVKGLFCPLCRDGRCLLYVHRPMICRLHGIAHEIHRPDRAVGYGPGCAAFETAAKGKPYIVFDRTEFYWELSRLEKEARGAFGMTQRVKMTISQMVTDFWNRRRRQGTTPHEKY